MNSATQQDRDSGRFGSGSGEHHQAVGWDDNVCRSRKAMQRRARGINRSAVSGHDRVHPVVIDVAVEYFSPRAAKRESDAIVVPGILSESCRHDDVLPGALEPTMKCDNPILVVNMKRIDMVAAQGRIVPAQPYQILRETQMIHPSGIDSRI